MNRSAVYKVEKIYHHIETFPSEAAAQRYLDQRVHQNFVHSPWVEIKKGSLSFRNKDGVWEDYVIMMKD